MNMTDLTVQKDDNVCTVVSIVPRTIRQEFPGLIPPVFEMEASDGSTPVCKIVKPAMHFVYLDETRGSLRVHDSPQEFARAICQDFCTSQIGVTAESQGMPGLFWLSGAHDPIDIVANHKVRLDGAVALQTIWLTDLAKLADNDWNRYHLHNVVSEFQIKAARMLGWSPDQHEWMTAEIKTETCPACGLPVGNKLIICNHCRCILKPEEYKKLQFA